MSVGCASAVVPKTASRTDLGTGSSAQATMWAAIRVAIHALSAAGYPSAWSGSRSTASGGG